MRNSGIYPHIIFMAAELHAAAQKLCRACALCKLRKKPYRLSVSTNATAYLQQIHVGLFFFGIKDRLGRIGGLIIVDE